MIAALRVLAIALAAFIGTIVIDASLGRIEGWLVRFLVWLFGIPSDVDDRPVAILASGRISSHRFGHQERRDGPTDR